MTDLRFFNYPGTESNSQSFHYSQAVRCGNIIKTSGQGGWDAEGNILSDPTAQVSRAFHNVLQALKAVDPHASWKNVYAIRTYHTNMLETFDYVTQNFKKLMPDHRPIWTCVEIGKLGIDGMVIEIEVEAVVDV